MRIPFTRAPWRILTVGILSVAALATLPASAQSPQATVRRVATLPDTGLAAFVNQGRPGTVSDDRGMLLGGIGSDLWRAAGDPAGSYWMVTDRGPNGQIKVSSVNRRTFPVPDFTPTILRVEINAEGRMVPRDILPIVGQSGKPVTGLSNLATDEVPYDYKAENTFPLNPSGLDTEGLVHTSNGDFWLAEEYSPSILRVDATGKVVRRYVPTGIGLTGADYPVSETLPKIFAKRRGNRGFESLALSPDGKTLYTAIQSPLRVPDSATGDTSRNIRVLAFDIATEKVTAEYVYQFQPFGEFNAPAADEMKISGLSALPDGKSLLVLERTDAVAKVFRVDLTTATNILATKWDDTATSPSLEGTADLKAAGVTALPKFLVVDLSTLPGMPGKIEGIALTGSDGIAVANDNDFDINTFDAAGRHVPLGVKSQILELALPGGFTGIAAPFVASPVAPTPTATSPSTTAAAPTPSVVPGPPKTGNSVAASQPTPWLVLAGALLVGLGLFGAARKAR